jgi:hypothetical protein
MAQHLQMGEKRLEKNAAKVHPDEVEMVFGIQDE